MLYLTINYNFGQRDERAVLLFWQDGTVPHHQQNKTTHFIFRFGKKR
jgi:hypothetical protein